jgi:hypothetical protein
MRKLISLRLSYILEFNYAFVLHSGYIIPMCTSYAPLLADLFFYIYIKADYMQGLLEDKIISV